MGFPLQLVGAKERLNWIKNNYNLETSIYMGDGIYDPIIFMQVMYSICPKNALEITKTFASYVTKSKGGERAVAEACIHILAKFFFKDISEMYVSR